MFSLKKKVKVSDIATCYKLFPSKYFKETEFLSKGFEFEVEVVAKYLQKYSYLNECGIGYQSRTYDEGKKIKFLDFFRYIYAIMRF